MFSVLLAWGCTQSKSENKDPKKAFTITQNVSPEYVSRIDSIKLLEAQNNVPDENYSSLRSVALEAKQAEQISDKVFEYHSYWASYNERMSKKRAECEKLESALDSSIKYYKVENSKIERLRDKQAETMARLERENNELNIQELRYKRKTEKLYADNQ